MGRNTEFDPGVRNPSLESACLPIRRRRQTRREQSSETEARSQGDMFLGFLVIVFPVAIATNPAKVLRAHRPELQVLRGLGLVGSAVAPYSYSQILWASALSFFSAGGYSRLLDLCRREPHHGERVVQCNTRARALLS